MLCSVPVAHSWSAGSACSLSTPTAVNAADTAFACGNRECVTSENRTDGARQRARQPMHYRSPWRTTRTTRQQYIFRLPHRLIRQSNGFPRATLGTAYRTWPRQFGEVISRAQHPCAALDRCALSDVFANAFDGLLPLRQHRGKQMPDVDHLLPDFESGLHPSHLSAFRQTGGIIKQGLGCADMDKQRW